MTTKNSPASTAPVLATTPAAAAPATTSATTPAAASLPATAPAATPITGVANANNKGKKTDLQSAYAALVLGLQQHYQPGDTFPLSTGTLTRDDLVAELQRFIAAAETTKTSNKAWRGDVQTERATLKEVEPIRQGVRSIIEARFGKGGIQLLDFGFTPRKAGKKTAASKAGAVVKQHATRQARGRRARSSAKPSPATSSA
jgi:hypothetical protein